MQEFPLFGACDWSHNRQASPEPAVVPLTKKLCAKSRATGGYTLRPRKGPARAKEAKAMRVAREATLHEAHSCTTEEVDPSALALPCV